MKKKVIMGSLVLCTLLASCGKPQKFQEDTGVDKNPSKSESVTVEENIEVYNSLLSEGDSLVDSEPEEAIEKYIEAKNLCPEKSEAYVKLINICNANEDIANVQSLLSEIESSVSSPSAELQALIDEES